MGQKIKCNKCGDIIESYSVHDFKWCSCNSIFIDGGDEYTRVGGELKDITYIKKEEEDTEYLPTCDTPVNSSLKTQVGGDHYKNMKIQPITFITVNEIPYCEANVIKYVCRHKNKDGIEDLKKAIHYLNVLIDKDYGKL